MPASGSDAEAWSSFDPSTVMQRHGPYRDVAGVIVTRDAAADRDYHTNSADALCKSARAQWISCDQVTLPGRHVWPFAADAFAATLPWLMQRLGAPGVSDPSLQAIPDRPRR